MKYIYDEHKIIEKADDMEEQLRNTLRGRHPHDANAL